uniref:HTH CENPB-type domain-containing protein n=1 Tax=Strongyloides venezuelensis TaxID=75913 RepID=A0A0K0F9T3_STRVS
MVPQKRKAYSTEEKLAILEDYSKVGSTAIKKKYGVSKANLSRWKKQKNELVERVADGLRESCIPVSGEVIQNEVIRLHKEALNNGEIVPSDFVASSGFLSRFLKKNDIRNYIISGESSGVPSETIDL